MRMRWWISLLVVAVVTAGCGGSGQQTTTEVEKYELTITGKDNAFEPDQVEIKAGREYEFTFKNQGTAVHNLVIQVKGAAEQDFTSDVAVNAGAESEFKVRLDREATYVMQCTYHPEMIGALKVVR
ncbi:MAG: cupredoxin domain-containing protein [bacterium]